MKTTCWANGCTVQYCRSSWNGSEPLPYWLRPLGVRCHGGPASQRGGGSRQTLIGSSPMSSTPRQREWGADQAWHRYSRHLREHGARSWRVLAEQAERSAILSAKLAPERRSGAERHNGSEFAATSHQITLSLSRRLPLPDRARPPARWAGPKLACRRQDWHGDRNGTYGGSQRRRRCPATAAATSRDRESHFGVTGTRSYNRMQPTPKSAASSPPRFGESSPWRRAGRLFRHRCHPRRYARWT